MPTGKTQNKKAGGFPNVIKLSPNDQKVPISLRDGGFFFVRG